MKRDGGLVKYLKLPNVVDGERWMVKCGRGRGRGKAGLDPNGELTIDVEIRFGVARGKHDRQLS